jgi:hypothetical protein
VIKAENGSIRLKKDLRNQPECVNFGREEEEK